MKLYLSTILLACAFLAPNYAYAQTNRSNISSNQTATFNSSVKQNTKNIASDWYKYTAKDGSYTVLFPKTPQEEAAKVGESNETYITYSDAANNRYYLASGSNIPGKIDTNLVDTNLLLNFIVENAAKSANANIESQTNITYKGFPAREAILRNKTSNAFVKVRYILDTKNSVLYQLLVASEKPQFDSPEITAFLDSLSIK